MSLFASVRFILSSHVDGICTSSQIKMWSRCAAALTWPKRLFQKGFSRDAWPKRLSQKGFSREAWPKRLSQKGFPREACPKRLSQKGFPKKAFPASWSCCRVSRNWNREGGAGGTQSLRTEMQTLTKKTHLYYSFVIYLYVHVYLT